MKAPTELIAQLPKTDLHVHLDGSLRISTLIDLARTYDVELPSYTEDGLRQLVFKPTYESLGDYLKGFRFTVAVLQQELALEQVAYELAQDPQQEGVRYLEVRFAPQLHVHAHLDAITVIRAVDRGLRRATQEFNQRASVVEGREPEFRYGIIVCAMRAFAAGSSEYFRDLLRVHRFAPEKEVFAAASQEAARAAIRARDEFDLPVVGFDLAGQEDGYPAVDHKEAYQIAHRNFLMKTVHAGEAYGPESIFQAITELHADRLGHGLYLFEHDMITSPEIRDREAYVTALSQYIADRRITVEVCLTSNLQTNPRLPDLSFHTLRKMNAARLSTTFCTDNRLISSTTVTQEICLAVEHLDLTPRQLKNSIIYGFKRSFLPGSYLDKRSYVRQIIDYFDQVWRDYATQHPDEPFCQLANRNRSLAQAEARATALAQGLPFDEDDGLLDGSGD